MFYDLHTETAHLMFQHIADFVGDEHPARAPLELEDETIEITIF